MEKIFSLILIILFIYPASSQERPQSRNQKEMIQLDSCQLRISYTFSYAVDTISNMRMCDQHRLEIGSKITHYYSYNAYRIDSIMNVAITDINPHKDLKPDEKLFYEDIYFNFPSRGEVLTLTGIINTDYEVVESIPEFNWNIDFNDHKEISGYVCNRAEACFRGRRWTVWYTKQIPIQYGPWKFSGLPGLILEASDHKNLFKWYAVEIKTNKNAPIWYYNKVNNKIVRSTRKQLARLQELQWKDFATLAITHGIKISIMDPQTKTIRQLQGGDYPTRLYIPPLELE